MALSIDLEKQLSKQKAVLTVLVAQLILHSQKYKIVVFINKRCNVEMILYKYTFLIFLFQDRARGFFSKFTPSTFMDFMKVLKRMGRLHTDFHTYYTLYKFHEMIDYLDMNEVAATCHTFNKHNIRAAVHHPLMKNIMFKIMHKVFENANTISNQALHFTDKYLSKFDVGIYGNNFWKDFFENANRNSSLDSDALLTIIFYASSNFQELEMHPL